MNQTPVCLLGIKTVKCFKSHQCNITTTIIYRQLFSSILAHT